MQVVIRADAGSGQRKAGGSGSKAAGKAPAGGSGNARMSGTQAQQRSKAGSGGATTVQRLSCFVNQQHKQGKRPTVAAKAFAPGDAQVCGSWQVHCSSGHKACTPAEVAARAWKWVYTAASVARCAEVQAQAVSGRRSGGGGFRHVTCCSTSKCNRPNAALDPQTQIANAA